MESSYWLARQNASEKSAEAAPSIEARIVHLELARLYRGKCDSLEELEARIKPSGESVFPSVNERPLKSEAPKLERRWSPQELTILRCFVSNGETIAEMASRMHRTPQSIRDQVAAQMATT